MGIKSLTQTIKRMSPESITHENLYKLSGKKVAVDASLIIYQQLLNIPNKNKDFFRNKEGKITNHINGLFYKIMNYISLNIELLFIFDGKPPDNKSKCIQERKDKCKHNQELIQQTNDDIKKFKLEKASTRLTKEMIDDVKHLLHLLGISYIHQDGEGEAIASELCRIGYVDYVLSEDMDCLVYGCPNLIRNCIDKSLKRKDIVSILNYNKIIDDFKMNHDQFIEFCILCGCDYCDPIPKIGNITAYKLFKKYHNIHEIIKNTNYKFPENYIETFTQAKENFNLFRDKIIINDLKIISSNKNIQELTKYLIEDIQLNEKRVKNTLKKFHNNYK
jgi:flap endonuclease-1